MKPFELPDFEIVELEIQDIVTSSNPSTEEFNDLMGWNGSWLS
jgi:hypothetical protein